MGVEVHTGHSILAVCISYQLNPQLHSGGRYASLNVSGKTLIFDGCDCLKTGNECTEINVSL